MMVYVEVIIRSEQKSANSSTQNGGISARQAEWRA